MKHSILNQSRLVLKIDPVRIVNMSVCVRVYVCVCVCVCRCVCAGVCVLVCVCVCVSPHPRLLITSAVIWTPHDWLNKFYNCFMTIVVVIVNGRSLGIDARRRHSPNKS